MSHRHLSAILGLADSSIKHFLLINQFLLIYKCYVCKTRDSQNLSFLDFKNNIINNKTLEERTSEKRKFLNKWQVINTVLGS